MAKENTGSFCLKEDGIHIEVNGREYRVSYEQICKPWKAALVWCKKLGGTRGSVEVWRAIARHRADINTALEAAGKEPIPARFHWTDEETFWSTGIASVVSMGGFGVGDGDKDGNFYVRAVSALN